MNDLLTEVLEMKQLFNTKKGYLVFDMNFAFIQDFVGDTKRWINSYGSNMLLSYISDELFDLNYVMLQNEKENNIMKDVWRYVFDYLKSDPYYVLQMIREESHYLTPDEYKCYFNEEYKEESVSLDKKMELRNIRILNMRVPYSINKIDTKKYKEFRELSFSKMLLNIDEEYIIEAFAKNSFEAKALKVLTKEKLIEIVIKRG